MPASHEEQSGQPELPKDQFSPDWKTVTYHWQFVDGENGTRSLPMQGDLDTFIDILAFAIDREQKEREAQDKEDTIPNFVVILTEIDEDNNAVYSRFPLFTLEHMQAILLERKNENLQAA